MDGAQEWCLQCGAGAPGSLGVGSSWRGPSVVILALVLLIAGAAVAGAAALGRRHAPPATVVKTIAQTPPASSPTGVTPSAPGLTTPTTPNSSIPAIPGSGTTSLPHASTKVPKFPLNLPTPKSSPTPTPTIPIPKGTSTGKTGTETAGNETTGTGNETSGSATQPEPILLDTDAASTYNPYNYPAANFGEPGFAIDGDPSTAWTAQLDPAVAPRMAEGLVLDLKTGHHVGSIEAQTVTPGMTVEVYGAKGHKVPPASITDPSWKQLSTPQALKAKDLLKLHSSRNTYRFLLLWITKAPAASIGTPQAPGHVSLNELVLRPPASS